ncbi:hypothetical protein J2Z79_000808 [Symbiobacterium terraclitae]|uniref:Right handed beta helix domain-containing protein n=1 Tax=Symbiobacterium terraclitae TaxID=557451 RepID=A0ABS4JPI2_9FIRM|nr:hypothetical protein [Symbiobacterium terraclitae]
MNQSAPGDTIRVAGGIYRESVTIGEEKARLAIIGSGAGDTILEGDGTGVGFTISGSSSVTIAGFTVTGFEVGIRVETSDNVIRNVTVTGSAASGIDVPQGGTRNLFFEIASNSNRVDGIVIRSSSNYVINSEFHNNTDDGIDFLGPNNVAIGNVATGNNTGLSTFGDNSVLIGNRFVGNQRALGMTGATGGLVYRNALSRSSENSVTILTVTNALLLGNEVSCSQGQGYRLSISEGLRAVENQVENNGTIGIVVGTERSVVDDNVVKDNAGAGIDAGSTATGNAVRRNQLKRNNPDIATRPPGDTNNVIDENRCKTSVPDGLCACDD